MKTQFLTKFWLLGLFWVSAIICFGQEVTWDHDASFKLCGSDQLTTLKIKNTSSTAIKTGTLVVNFPSELTIAISSIPSGVSLSSNTVTWIHPAINPGETINLPVLVGVACNNSNFGVQPLVQFNYNYSYDGINILSKSFSETVNVTGLKIDVNIASPTGNKYWNMYDNVSEKVKFRVDGTDLAGKTFGLRMYLDANAIVAYQNLSSIKYAGTTLVSGTDYNVNLVTPASPAYVDIVFNNGSSLILGSINSSKLFEIDIIFRATQCFAKLSNVKNRIQPFIKCGPDGEPCLQNKTFELPFEWESRIPSLPIMTTTSDKNYDFCGAKSHYKVVYTLPIASPAPWYDFGITIDKAATDIIDGIKINGISVTAGPFPPFALLVNTPPTLINHFDPTIGDLNPGESIVLEYDLSHAPFSSVLACSNKHDFHSLNVKPIAIKDLCANIIKRELVFIDNITSQSSISKERFLLSGASDIDYATTQEYTLDSRVVFTAGELLEEKKFKLRLNITVPCKTEIAPSKVYYFRTNPNPANKFADFEMVLDSPSPVTLPDGKKEYHFISTSTFDMGWYEKGPMTPWNQTVYFLEGLFKFKVRVTESTCAQNCTPTDPTISAKFFADYEDVCGHKLFNIGCAQQRVMPHCENIYPPGPCTGDVNPLDIKSFKAYRTSYGNYAGTSTPIAVSDAILSTSIKSKNLIYCDLARSETQAIVTCDGTKELYGYIQYKKKRKTSSTFMKDNLLKMVKATYIYDGTLYTASGFNRVPALEGDSLVVYQVNLGLLTFNSGKALNLICDYEVSDSLNFSPYDPASPFKMDYFLSNFSNKPKDLNQETYGENLDFYRIGVTTAVYPTNATCGQQLTTHFGLQVSEANWNFFPNEDRPFFPYIDPVYFKLPTIGSSDFTVTNVKSSRGETISFVPDLATNTYTLTPPAGGWKGIFIGRSADPCTQCFPAYEMYIDFAIKDCPKDKPLEMNDIITAYKYKDQCGAPQSVSHNVMNLRVNPVPSTALIHKVLTTDLDLYNTVEKMQFGFITSQEINYPWVKFEYDKTKLALEVNTILATSPFFGSTLLSGPTEPDFYALKSFGVGEIKDFIKFTQKICEEMNLDVKVSYGFSCNPITKETISNGNSLCPSGQVILKIHLYKPQIKLDAYALFNENEQQDVCNNMTYVLQIFNIGRQNVSDPSLKIDLPSGYTLEGIKYKYPILETEVLPDPFDYATFSPVGFTAGTASVSWPLNTSAGPLTSLPGSWSNTPGAPLKNFYQMLVTVKPTCDADGQKPIKFSIQGSGVCKEELSKVIAEKNIRLKGIGDLPTISHDLTMNVTKLTCGKYKATVNFVSSTGLFGVTGATIDVTAPAGVITTPSPLVLGPINPAPGTAQTFNFTFETASDFCGELEFTYDLTVPYALKCGKETCKEQKFIFTKTAKVDVCCYKDCGITPILCISELKGKLCTEAPCGLYNFVNLTSLTGTGLSYGEVIWQITDLSTGVVIHAQTGPKEGIMYQFLSDGTYKVCMTVRLVDSKGAICESQICEEVIVKCESCQFEPQILIQTQQGCENVVFTAGGILPAYIKTWKWELITPTTPHPTLSGMGSISPFAVSLPASGSYQVLLTVEGGPNEGSICSKTVEIIFKKDCPCKTEVTVEAFQIENSCKYKFVPTVTSTGTILGYHFSIVGPDGTVYFDEDQPIGTLPSSFEVDLVPGESTVNLIVYVKDCDGKASIKITPACCQIDPFDFEVQDANNNCYHKTFHITDLLDNTTGINYTWKIYKGLALVAEYGPLSGQLVDQTHLFNENGLHRIVLTITRTVGNKECTAEVIRNIKINCKKTACTGTPDMDAQMKGCKISVKDNSILPAGAVVVSRNWSYTDGVGVFNPDKSAGAINFIPYALHPTVTITLHVVYSVNGEICEMTVSRTIQIPENCQKPQTKKADIGVSVTPEERLVRVFPNPTNGMITLHVDIDNDYYWNAEISSSDERIIFSRQIEQADTFIDLSNEPAGVYSITVRSANFVKRVQFVKE